MTISESKCQSALEGAKNNGQTSFGLGLSVGVVKNSRRKV